jgi:pyruvate/2-oxoglutarate dehydrogenase complex dihydrolipoamide dehydrogenase (E3) component
MKQNSVKDFDAIIIGSGQGGVPLAVSLSKAGWKIAVIERSYLGGSCINYGCTPTKTMVASAKTAFTCRNSSDYGIKVSSVKVNIKGVRNRKNSIVQSFRKGTENRLAGNDNITLFNGQASFENENTIIIKKGNVQDNIYGKKIFINVGCRPAIPPIEGLETVPYLDSTSIMDLNEIPGHLIIIGGGYIGLEFGQMFRRFGSKVTIIQHGSQLLAREDKDVADEILKVIKEEGIKVFFNTEVIKIKKIKSGGIKAILKNSKPNSITGSHLLIATGRIPNSDSLNVSNVGIETDDKGFIKVNEKLEANVQGIYAIGDVKGGPAFTHISYDDYRILKKNILEGENATTKGRIVPYTVFIDPQLGRVGMSEDEARRKGFNILTAKMQMSNVTRAIETGETRGLMKVIIDKNSERILGCAILGMEGGEIMSVLQIAMMAELKYTALRDGTFAHPTLAESLNNLFMNLE